MAYDRQRCAHCQRTLIVHVDVVAGVITEDIEFCGCPESRRVAGICRDCSVPVSGARGRALRCDEHRKQAQREYYRRYRASEKGQAAHRRDAEKRRTDPVLRERRRVYEREYRNSERGKAVKRKNRRKRTLAGKIAAEKRAWVERNRDKVREQNRRARARARIKRREHQHRYYTVYVGPGRKPTCEQCGEEVPWSGVGRPMQQCETCDPKRWAAKRKRDERAARRERREAA